MRSIDDRTALNLVLTHGFSKRNAERAVEMFRAGELSKLEEEVINRIMLNPESDNGSESHSWTANHLNYRITLAGGDAVTRGKRI